MPIPASASVPSQDMAVSVTAVAVGTVFQCIENNRSYQATMTGGAAMGATVKIMASATMAGPFLLLGTITLSASTPSDGFPSNANWTFVRADVTAITGAASSVSVVMGS